MICDDGLGKIFLEKANLFKHYANYCVNHIGMSQKLMSLRENAKVTDFLEVRSPSTLKLSQCFASSNLIYSTLGSRSVRRTQTAGI